MRRVMKDPLRPPKAAADATRVHPPRKRDNVLPTMDEHGVEDIVRNLSRQRTPGEAQNDLTRDYRSAAAGTQYPPGPERDEELRQQNPHLGVESARIAAGIPDDDLGRDLKQADQNLASQPAFGMRLTKHTVREGYPETRKPGLEDASRAVATPSNVGLRGTRINNEGEGGPVTAGTRGNRQVDARTSVSPKVPRIPARNRGVEEAINEGAADLSNVIANRNARVKKRRQAPTD